MAPDRSKAGGNRNRPDVLMDERAIRRVHLDHHRVSSHQTVKTTIRKTPVTDLADVQVDKTSDDFAAGQSLVWSGDAWIAGDPEVLVPVKASEEISKGTPVYVSAEHASGKPVVSKAQSNGSGTYPAIGLLLSDLAADAEGHAVGGGILSGLNTASFSAGDSLYLSSSTGDLTNTRPTASSEKVQKVAVVVRSHASAGAVIVMGAGRVNDVNNELTALTGVSLNATNLGTFTGSTIADSETVKGALQDLETAVESSVQTSDIADGAVTTVKLAADAVTGAKLADDAVASEHIADDAVVAAAIADGAVDAARLATNAVTTVKITDANVTAAKLATDAKVSTMLAVGTSTASVANTTIYASWDTSSSDALADSTNNIVVNDSDAAQIDISADGRYQIDCSFRMSGNNRVEAFCRTWLDTGSGFVRQSMHTASNYSSRDSDQNTGSVTLSTILSLSSGDKLKFQAEADADGTANMVTNGTLLRIIRHV